LKNESTTALRAVNLSNPEVGLRDLGDLGDLGDAVLEPFENREGVN